LSVITVLDRASSVGGGLAFAIFWIGGLLDMSVGDWGLSLALHALTIVLLTWAGFAILRTRTVGPYQVGGVGLAMIVIGLVASLELVMVGMFLLGSLAASGPTSTVRRVGAFLLMGGAVVFLTVRAINGPFWGDGTPDPSPTAAVGFGMSLVALGLGWIALGLAQNPVVHAPLRQFTS
jgi:hypothetical protein